MAINEKLQAYKETDEFKELLSKCKNKIDNKKAAIDTKYEGEEREVEEPTKNDFDVAEVKVKVFTFILENITEKSGEELKTDIEEEVVILKAYKYKALNGFGNPNSMLRYTETDMLRFEASYLDGLEGRLDTLIGTEDVKVPDDIGAFDK